MLDILLTVLIGFIVLGILVHVRYPWIWLDIQFFLLVLRGLKRFIKWKNSGTFLPDLFEEAVRKDPNKVFLKYAEQVYTYKQADENANKISHCLKELGLQKGDILSLMMFNEPAFIWIYLGALKIGVKVAFLNYNLRAKSLLHSLDVSGGKILIIGAENELIKAIQDIKGPLENNSIPVYISGTSDPPPGFISLTNMYCNASKEPISATEREGVKVTDPACFIYTSGTTGLPKAAIVTHARCLRGSLVGSYADMAANDVFYIVMPLYHSASNLIAFGGVIASGATIVLRNKFSARCFWDDCRNYDVTIIQYIGEICRYLVAQPKNSQDGIHKIRVAYGNGLRSDIWQEFKDRFKIPRILEFYAATEGNAGFLNIDNKFGSVGRLSPLLQKIFPVEFVKYDIEQGAAVRDSNGRCIKAEKGEAGLMVCKIKKDSEFDGYKGQASLTNSKILQDVLVPGDQYFNSGDLFTRDDMYFIYFKDRIGDTFRFKGENVSTMEVSNVLSSCSFIQDACVYGVAVPGYDGKAGMAVVSLTEHQVELSNTHLRDIFHHLQELLPPYAQPKFLRLEKEISLTGTYKQMKVSYSQDGFNPAAIDSPLYIVDNRNKTYVVLDSKLYEEVVRGDFKL
ncbi:unnamed protein product [Owenia fusiformis]|uniref:Very long-chain fatty acid transport protein n=1 Tax=Owenia fusiformis TaxID=6347 RepID=A0A8J1TV48_OWEFU|nr:unnamed protein product [Owenia fusiformis]